MNERGRDVNGIIKQWLTFVKPNFLKVRYRLNCLLYPMSFQLTRSSLSTRKERWPISLCHVVCRTRLLSVRCRHICPPPLTAANSTATVVQYIQQKLVEKSQQHQANLTQLQREATAQTLSDRVHFLQQTPQMRGMNTIIHDTATTSGDFIFYFDRLAALLTELALNNARFAENVVETPQGNKYRGLKGEGLVSAVVLERGGAALLTGLQRVIPDCRLSHILIESNVRTGEPELRYQKLTTSISTHSTVLLLDAQMSSGGSALMAVQVLLDHGVPEDRIVFATYSAGRMGLQRLTVCFPQISVVVCHLAEDVEERWIEKRYFRC